MDLNKPHIVFFIVFMVLILIVSVGSTKRVVIPTDEENNDELSFYPIWLRRSFKQANL